MTGVSQQTLGFLTSANKAIPYESISHAPGSTSSSGSSKGGQSFLSTLGSIGSRALDVLSRPMYASASFADQLVKQGFGQGQPGTSPLGAIWTGLEGKTKTDFTQVVQDYADLEKQRMANAAVGRGYDNASGWKPGEASVNPWLKLGLGLGGDIFLDPSTYVGPGLIKDIIKAPIVAAKGSSVAAKGAHAVEDVAANVAHTVDEAQKADEALHPTLPSAEGLLNSPAPAPITPTPKVPPGKAFADELLGGGIRPPTRHEQVQLTFEEPGGPLNPNRDLPAALQGAKPRFGYGKKLFPLEFADGVTKALYIVRNGKKLSTKDEAYMSFLRDHFIGETDAEIRARGAKVHSTIKDLASRAPDGQTLVLGQHPAAISRASEDAIKTHQAIAAARDTEQAINNLETPAEKVEAGISAKNAAKGDPYLSHVIGETVDRATADAVPKEIKTASGGNAGKSLYEDFINGPSAKGNRAANAVMNERFRRLNPRNPYNTSGRSRLRETTWLKHFSHTAGERNTHRMAAAHMDETVQRNQAVSTVMANSLVKFPEDVRVTAFTAVKNDFNAAPANPQVAAAAKVINAWINRTLGPAGVSEKALHGTTDLTQWGIGMKALNEELPANLQFTNGIVKTRDGRTLDFSGAKWRNSWQIWDVKDPIEALYNMQSAVTKTIAEKQFYASLPLMTEGIYLKHDPGLVKVSHPLGYTEGYYFEPWLVPEVKNWQKSINEFKGGRGKGWETYDRWLTAWKTAVTLPNPVHHAHNFEGDFFLSFMRGLTNPLYYTRSARVGVAQHNLLHGFNPLLQEEQGLDKLLRPGGLADIVEGGHPVNPKSIVARIPLGRGKDQAFDTDMVAIALHQMGVLPKYQTVEDLAQFSSRYKPLFKGPFNGKLMQKLGRISEGREHFERIAYFLYRLEHPPKGRYYTSVREALEEAAADTKFTHPTGQDLTQFERTYMRRLFPFYSWTRNSTPAVMRAFAERPGRAIAFYKFEHSLALSNGVPQPSMSDQFPTDQAFPNWIRQGILGPSLGSPGGYTTIDISDPVNSGIAKMLVDPAHFVGGSLSPFAQVPVGVLGGANLASGAAISSRGTYLNQQTPITSLLDRILGVNIGPGSLLPQETKNGLQLPPLKTPTQEKASNNDFTGLLNWLTGAGLFNTGKYVPGKKVKAKTP